jgi:hypothetical protein
MGWGGVSRGCGVVGWGGVGSPGCGWVGWPMGISQLSAKTDKTQLSLLFNL